MDHKSSGSTFAGGANGNDGLFFDQILTKSLSVSLDLYSFGLANMYSLFFLVNVATKIALSGTSGISRLSPSCCSKTRESYEYSDAPSRKGYLVYLVCQ